MATVVGMRTVLLKTSPFSQARVPLRLGLAPHTGTGHAFRGDAAASYMVRKVRTTFVGRPLGMFFGSGAILA